MAGTIEDKVFALAQPLVESMGLQMWGVRYRGGRDRACLQIFIDSPEGITIDQCGEVNNLLSPALDAADFIAPAYLLEISSPGMDRILFTLDQAAAFIGSRVRAEFKIPTAGRRRVEGTLLKADPDGMITIEDHEGNPLEAAFANIGILRVVPVFSVKSKPHGGTAKK